MASWVDVERLMAYWYREGDHNVWAERDWAELGQELEAIDTFGPEDRAILADNVWADWAELGQELDAPDNFLDRAILADVRKDLIDQMVCVAEELRPQLRLAAADRRASKSLGR